MVKRLFATLAVALGLSNLATAFFKLPVMSWFATRRRDALAGGFLAVLGILARPIWWLVPVLVPLQFGAASIRGLFKRKSIFDHGQASDITRADDSCIPALLFKNPASNSAILYIHGAGNSKTRYAHRPVSHLYNAGFTVLSIDLDGHGDNVRLFDLPSIYDCIGESVAWLKQHYDQVAIYAVSLGGAIAARAVADGIDVDALAIIESPASLDFQARPYYWSEFWALWRPAFWRSEDGITPLELLKQWSSTPIRTKRPLKTVFDELDICSAIPKLNVPTLLQYSTDDWIARFAPILHSLPASSNTTMHIFHGMAHLGVTMEQAPLDDAVAWLKSIIVDRKQVLDDRR